MVANLITSVEALSVDEFGNIPASKPSEQDNIFLENQGEQNANFITPQNTKIGKRNMSTTKFRKKYTPINRILLKS